MWNSSCSTKQLLHSTLFPHSKLVKASYGKGKETDLLLVVYSNQSSASDRLGSLQREQKCHVEWGFQPLQTGKNASVLPTFDQN
jgi:hypothetical protein